MAAYYNEIDAYAAQWLRNLIVAGHIAPGDVDERSIEDVKPDDLRPYTQCHFFAGIGVWSLALRRAGWPDTRAVWTGSCPCQPFSAAGQGNGFDDQRHLWPHFHYLISQHRPAVVYGEQVAGHDAAPWLDLVQTDLEALGYAFGAVAFPSAGVGAPHIRDRTYWLGVGMADANGAGPQGRGERWDGTDQRATGSGGLVSIVADPDGGIGGQGGTDIRGGSSGSVAVCGAGLGGGGVLGRLAVSDGARLEERSRRPDERQPPCESGFTPGVGPVADGQPGPTNGRWADADWLFCRDAKWRPVEPGTFPLAHGASSRVGRLRAYGNAINAEAAEEFIRATVINIT